MSLKNTVIFTVFLVFALGCSAQNAPEALRRQWLPFLEDGATSKIVILSRLGRPTSRLQKERIFTYRLQLDHKDVLRPVSQELDEFIVDRILYGENAMYSLVLIFDDKDVLRKHNLVEIVP